MKYPYLLLDADNTVFDFDAGNRHAFHEVCARYDIPDTEESFQCYERCNNAMWAAFDRGECTKDFLVVERFRRFLKEMGLDRDAARCNELHLQVLGQNTLLLPHALEVCRGLSREHRLYIVTNAVAAVQRSRLAGSAIAPYITGAFISEEAGASKPSAAYFDYVFSRRLKLVVHVGGDDEIVLVPHQLQQVIVHRLGRWRVAVEPDIAAPEGPALLLRGEGVEPVGVHIVKAVLLLKVGEVPFKPLPVIGEARRRGQPGPGADDHGVAVRQGLPQPVSGTGAGGKFRCPGL